MNLFGRTWQVQVQAEAADRASVDDIYRINVRNSEGKMIPLRSLVEVRVVVGPPALIRYNNLRAVTVQGSPAPGVSSGQALKAMEEVAAHDASAGLCGRMDRYGIPGEARGRQDRDHPRLRGAVRVSVPGRALRKLDHSGAGAAVGIGRHPRIVRRHCARPSDARSLCADRHHRADRPCRKERHSDRRVCEGEAGARGAAARGRNRGRAGALPPGDDDVVRLHPRSASPGGCCQAPRSLLGATSEPRCSAA